MHIYISDSAFIPASENKDKYGHLLRSLNLKPCATPTLFLDDLDDEDQTNEKESEREVNESRDNQENENISINEELTTINDVENLREIEKDVDEVTNKDMGDNVEEELLLPDPTPNHEPEVNKQLMTTTGSPPRKRERGGMRVSCPECQIQIHPHSLTRHITKVHRTPGQPQDNSGKKCPSTNTPQETGTGIKQYRVSCPECHIQIHPNSLTRHLAKIHRISEKDDQSPPVPDRISCPECQIQIHPNSLTRHISNVHSTTTNKHFHEISKNSTTTKFSTNNYEQDDQEITCEINPEDFLLHSMQEDDDDDKVNDEEPEKEVQNDTGRISDIRTTTGYPDQHGGPSNVFVNVYDNHEMPSVTEVCENFDLNNVDVEYTEDNFQNLTTYKLYQVKKLIHVAISRNF